MKVSWAVQPFRPLCEWLAPVLPVKVTGVSVGLLKATALEVAILAGHVLLYPSGIVQERRTAPTLPARALPDHRPSTTHDATATTETTDTRTPAATDTATRTPTDTTDTATTDS
ncbi:hypothetical protein NGM37_36825, partial [Streptomyces sp. TRM76130]|nr:hypothetical protein [Streptomyces sp. TRM76130]